MKRSNFLVIGVITTACLLISCTSLKVFDDSLNDEQVATVHFVANGLTITEYNGIPVGWKPVGFQGMGTRIIKIPGGNTTFMLDGMVGTVNMGYTYYRNIPFVYNFENGKEYNVSVNQNIIYVYNGPKARWKNLAVRFNMSNGQRAIER